MRTGYEVRNSWLGNISINNINTEVPTGENNQPTGLDGRENRESGKPGVEGNGFWFAGFGYSTFDRNEAWGNSTGFNLFNRDGKPGLYPSQPGCLLDTQYQPQNQAPPFTLLDHTLVVGSRLLGMEVWGLHNPDLLTSDLGTPVISNYVGVNNKQGFVLEQADDGDNYVTLRTPVISQPIYWTETTFYASTPQMEDCGTWSTRARAFRLRRAMSHGST